MMDEKLKLAIRAVNQDGTSLKSAAKQFGVARTTLKRHLTNPEVKSSGRPRFFSDSEEQLLHQILRNIQVLQQPFSRPKFVEVARKLAARKGFTERNFGKEWLYKFVRRHPDLALRSKTWRSEQKKWSSDKCEKYIEVLDYLHQEGFLSDPRGIFVVDSMEIVVPPKEYTKSGNLIPRKPSNEIGYAAFICGSADGAAQRPLILRDGNLVLEPWFVDEKSECVVGQNSTGCLDVDALAAYLKRELVPHIKSLDPPVDKCTLFLDGRWSHAYNLEILESCLLHNIQVVCPPVGHAEKLQPMKKKDFRLVMKAWLDFTDERDANPLHEFIRPNAALMRNLTAQQYKDHIGGLLRDGFAEMGIFPFAPELIRATLPDASKTGNNPASNELFLRLVENYCLQISGEHGISEQVVAAALEEYKRALLEAISQSETLDLTPHLNQPDPINLNLLQVDANGQLVFRPSTAVDTLLSSASKA